MSVRAYMVKEIVRGEEVFNLWYDEKLVVTLEDAGYLSQLNDDLGGFIEISRAFFENFLTELDEDESLYKRIKQFLEKYPNEDYFLFHCF